MNDLTVDQLKDLIKEKRSENEAYRLAWESTLTPEQKALREAFWQANRENVDPLVRLKEELDLKEKIEKAKKEDPLIKEIEVPTLTTIVQPKGKRYHYLFPLVVKALKAKCHVWLVGPAGSGKTTLASHVAESLNLPFAALSVCSQTTKTDLLGYLDAQGVYRSTSFRDLYENGGVYCLDEIDNGNANVLAVLNSSLASDSSLFPDKIVKRHPDFIIVACANTFGLGATGGYVGRTQIDGATLDRFFFVEMPYDEGLEAQVAGFSNVPSPVCDLNPAKVPTPAAWTALVKKTRQAVAELGVKAIVSPRATFMGLALIKQKVPLDFLEKGLLYKAMSPETIAKIRQA
jgi:hypothetical protein